ncbi:putative baseplate assembly protein [Hymenobacter bucti]|uniref:Baseplate assembly protein n=1 Tax=Hymenobacter bucti TaxID=1844114 RepID=A0ABW4R1I4_9BACT
MFYACCDESRRNLIKGNPAVNGIDFLEVVDKPSDPNEQRQTTLAVHLINDFQPVDLAALTVVIEGGERIRNIRVTGVSVLAGLPGFPPSSPPGSPPAPPQSRVLLVTVSEAGDFSPYTLRLVQDLQAKQSPPGFDPVLFDPILSAVAFSFKVSCPSDFDCQPVPCIPAKPTEALQVNYLAKDYASFRQLMLDRLALLVPDYQERNVADLGITLLELLAYVADYLSYQQDATATEAYLNTARKRTSVRRHARLVDYFMHDGCNARVWVQVQLAPGAGKVLLQKENQGRKTQFLTRVRDATSPIIFIESAAYEKALAAGPQVFELMQDETLFSEHTEMPFYTWGDTDCCLPAGATSATLAGHFPQLAPGQVLILAENRGPQTGLAGDADPTHRQAVRLTDVSWSTDPLGMQRTPPGPLPAGIVPVVTNIRWHPADALSIVLCLSARHGTQFYDHVSMAWGNIVLADHGLTVQEQQTSALTPDTVPPSTRHRPRIVAGHCQASPEVPIPARFRPQLAVGSLTQAAPYDPQNPPPAATGAMTWSMREPLPVVSLREQKADGLPDQVIFWKPQRDFINSQPTAPDFVVEVETDGVAYLRFGDDVLGSRPAAATVFRATYRVGNGLSGNIGAETLAYLATNDSAITLHPTSIIGIRNPLPARGGVAPETMEEARQKAPSAFRRQERAVTPADYEEISQRIDATIQRTACTFRWTGSWRTAFLTVDRAGGQAVDVPFEQQTRTKLERYRMAGYDLEVEGPQYVSLEMVMEVCVDRNYFASEVKAALLRVFTRAYQPSGQPGLFHPDQFTFGQLVYLSPFYAAAQATPGVLSVQITTFRRQGSFDAGTLTSGKIPLGRLEIARLDNDPNFPDHGVFNLLMKGGR